MREVIRAYGRFLLEAGVFALLMILFLSGIKDEEGNSGIFEVTGAKLVTETIQHDTYTDFSKDFREESEKVYPQISYCGTYLRTGQNSLSDCISVTDYAGMELEKEIKEIVNPAGDDITDLYQPATTEIYLAEPGIYVVTVRAVDDGNRNTECRIRIPVNK